MDRTDELRKIVARLADAEPSAIEAGFSLNSNGLNSSVRRAALAAAIRRHLEVDCPLAYTAATFGDLESAVRGNGAKPASSNGAVKSPVFEALIPKAISENGLACGIDMEMVMEMPETEDYWEHEFYQESFSHDEIAYCVLQENPRMHFAARWCAKEALIKCEPAFREVKLSEMEVVRAASGALSLAHRAEGASRKLSHAVSVSHTETMAIAMVVGMRES